MAEPRHAMLPRTLHDEAAMQDFVAAFRGHLSAQVVPGNRKLYQQRIGPDFERRHHRPPADRHEIRRLMEQHPYYQFWSAMQRRSQEMMWESLIDPTNRALPGLIAKSRQLNNRSARHRGLLRPDPSLQIPRYHTVHDIHLMPGGYHSNNTEDDIAAGALYEGGLPLYMGDLFGPENDLMGQLLLGFLRRDWPEFKPLRILDMGCAAGNSTLPWARAFGQAEVHAIDVGAPVLRYAHARAKALGVAVHFSQQNAEHTDFEAESFDLIVSHIMLHETSRKALRNILGESWRLLRPGGLMLHFEIPRGNDDFEQFMHDWETYNNNETFAGFMTSINLTELAREAGFAADKTRIGGASTVMDQSQMNYVEDEFVWPVLVGEK